MGRSPIEAAGGIVWRRQGESLEVLLVHRPKYDDWTFPKGKLKKREDALEGALREVAEETGYHCGPGAELPPIRYRHRSGREKRVRYWAMSVEAGYFRSNAEVDMAIWVHVEVARARLTYPHDIVVIDALQEVFIEV